MAQVCSEYYEPERATEPVKPKGPTAFTLGSLAVDDAIYGEPTTHIEFAEAKQASDFARVRIQEATSDSQVEELLDAARSKLEESLSSTKDRREVQSLRARLNNIEQAAKRRKVELEKGKSDRSAQSDLLGLKAVAYTRLTAPNFRPGVTDEQKTATLKALEAERKDAVEVVIRARQRAAWVRNSHDFHLDSLGGFKWSGPRPVGSLGILL